MAPTLLINAAIGFIIQLIVFLIIPLVVYLIWYRRKESFFRWVGLKTAPPTALLFAMGIALLLAAIKIPLAWSLLHQPKTVSGELLTTFNEHGWSIWLVGTILITAWLKTAFIEELFFRGFLATRLIAWLGFNVGNLLQAIIFGLVHLPLIFIVPDDFRLQSIILVIGSVVGGWLMGWLNHKHDDSIMPSWIMHGLGNTLAYATPLMAM